MNINKAHIAAFGYSIFVGISFLITKLMIPHDSPSIILAHRFTIAFVVYLAYFYLTKTGIQITRKKMLSILPLAPFYPLMFFILQAFGLKYASSSEAGIIFATIPIITMLLISLIGKRPSLVQSLSILLSVSGVLIGFIGNFDTLNFSSNSLGILLLFMSALSFSIYTILVKKAVTIVSIHELTFVNITIGFIGFNIIALIESNDMMIFFIEYLQAFKSVTYAVCILYSGVIAMIGTSLFSNYALKHLSPSKFSVYTNLSTLISIVSGAVFLSEPLYINHYIGSAFILIGVISSNFSNIIEKKTPLLLKRS
ncbi:DMT family transporter [Acidaminobacter sp. JC074]|uniref:DMT family transporter n=1 Tax=Acidaminobacter sp. JC074 TaxID=2530199 RepID=UPI001F0FA669|nr:DMT family transporter [Acidaminobacter sp. JC074]